MFGKQICLIITRDYTKNVSLDFDLHRWLIFYANASFSALTVMLFSEPLVQWVDIFYTHLLVCEWSEPGGRKKEAELTVVVLTRPPGCVQVQPDLLTNRSQPSSSKHGTISHHCFFRTIPAAENAEKQKEEERLERWEKIAGINRW